MEKEVLLSIRGLTKSFESAGRSVRALYDVSFDIMRGEIFGLVGESGSGKSTTGRIISGIYEPSDGTVLFAGEVIRASREAVGARISGLKREARRKRLRLTACAMLRPKEWTKMLGMLEKVKEDLQNKLKSEREALIIASDAMRKYGKRAHPAIRMVFQDPSASLNPRMTVGEAVGEALVAVGVRDDREIERRVGEALVAVGLSPGAASRYPAEFSGGQRQRVGIARAVITRPELLIADEPISALDVSVGAQVINLLLSLAKDMSLSVLFIAHDLAAVRHMCDRVGVMYRGRMVELAETEELFENPRHPYTRALLSAAPPPDPRRARAYVRDPAPANYPTEGDFTDIGGGHFVLGGDIYAE